VEPLPDPLPKYAAQAGSTLFGSASNRSFISSTSHSLAPKSEELGPLLVDGPVDCDTTCFASSGVLLA